jgi:parallel beta-helix repeat protein
MSGSWRNGHPRASFFRRWLPWSANQKPMNKRRRSSFHPTIEPLEDRRLLSFTVTTTVDNGSNTTPTLGSLRWAIVQANLASPPSTINFAIGNTTETIKPPTALPAVTANSVTITTAPPPSFPSQQIILDGSAAGLASGLILNGSSCTVEGSSTSNLFAIQHFSAFGILVQGSKATITSCELIEDGAGIVVSAASQGDIASNYVGTNPFAVTGLGNSGDGVRVISTASSSATQNLIAGNVIAGNTGNGVTLTGPGTSSNSLVNNQIGALLATITAGPTLYALGNKLDGVDVFAGANNNQIGNTGLFPSSTGAGGNLIASNGANGVQLSGSGTIQNKVQGNLIGTNNTGNGNIAPGNMGATGNTLHGVVLDTGAQNNLVGGGGGLGSAGQGNLIAANLQGGVDVNGSGTSSNSLTDNFIGTDLTGAVKLANNGSGVSLVGSASTNTVQANLISGNTAGGVVLTDSGTTGNLVQTNTIGTNLNKSGPLGNGGDGVTIKNGASGNTIGGATTTSSAGNLISSNVGNGVTITGSGTANNLVEGNAIGLDGTGTIPLPNVEGVSILSGAASNIVGGTTPAATNVISGNSDEGILLEGSSNTIEGNDIGNSLGGTIPLPNQHDGIFISVMSGPGGNTVGGTIAGSGNLISGNGGNGIDITGPTTAGNVIEGNDIGTVQGGTSALENLLNGILINNTTGYTIGGSVAAGNLISGNGRDGVQLTGQLTTGIVLYGNRIGTDVTGMKAVPNQGYGVHILNSASGNTVGGAAPSSGPANLISGNQASGVAIGGVQNLPGTTLASNNLVQGNYIGTTITGVARLANGGDGVNLFFGGGNNQVGGPGGVAALGLGNLISANNGSGVSIIGSTGNGLLGNEIGSDVTGTAYLGNLGNGVHLLFASNNSIGTPAVAGNLISGNFQDGVRLAGQSNGNTIMANQIGTDLSGTMRLANNGNGVILLQGSSNNTVSSNLISGNVGSGVVLSAGGTMLNRVQSNEIGTTASGLLPLGNSRDGVDVLLGAASNQIGSGGGPTAAGNLISGNQGSGVVLSDPGTTLNVVEGNFIGTTKTGAAPVRNLKDGVDIVNGAASNQVGGSGGIGPGGLGNLISGNGVMPGTGDGVHIEGSGSSFDTIQGNLIGTDVTGKLPLSNVGNGVAVIHNAQHNAIGGTGISGNVIAYNLRVGVVVGANPFDAATLNNSILSNSIFHNAVLGIDLGNDGVTLNHPFNPAFGPNDFQNFPVVQAALATGSTTSILVTLHSIPLTSFRIQLFLNPAADPSGYGQGQTLLSTLSLSTNGSGDFKVIVLAPQNLAGQYVTATATAPSGDTSEFSKDLRVAGRPSLIVGPGGSPATALLTSGPANTPLSGLTLPTGVSQTSLTVPPPSRESAVYPSNSPAPSASLRPATQRTPLAIENALDAVFAALTDHLAAIL